MANFDEEQQPVTGSAADGSDEDLVAGLLKAAGRRPPVRDDVLNALRHRTREHWRRKVAQEQAKRQRRQWLAVAATVVATVGGSWFWSQQKSAPPPAPIARVAEVFGGDWQTPPQGLVPGAILETRGPVRLALRMKDGAALRLDVDTRLELRRQDLVRLEGGGVYIDTEGSDGDVSLAVETALGSARDIGTQFEVRLDTDLHVRVRRGEVQIDTTGGAHRASAGSYLRVAADGSVEKGGLSSHGGPWSWVLDAVPANDLEGQSLASALRWMTDETGWEVRFEDAELESQVGDIVILGAGAGLRPEEVAEVLLPGSGLTSGWSDDGVLEVRRLEASSAPRR